MIAPGVGDHVSVHQDASVFVSHLEEGNEVTHELGNGRGAYLYVIEGSVSLNGEAMATGDAAKVTDEAALVIRADDASELILVDVPMTFEPVGIWAGR